jgi:hypothetical protein
MARIAFHLLCQKDLDRVRQQVADLTAAFVHAALDRDDADMIESVEFFSADWIKTGFREERVVYRHLFKERRQKRLYCAAFQAQRRPGLKQWLPRELQIRIGSQWRCLRRGTVDAILRFRRARPDVVRFFRHRWIPDATFFQTLVHNLVPGAEIPSRAPTSPMFSDYGMSVTFYNDHHDPMLGQDCFFARKISPQASDLKVRLGRLCSEARRRFEISGKGQRVCDFVTGQDRVGRRVGTRIWEREATLGPDRTLRVVVCKKWHLARRFAGAASRASNLPALGCLFDEEDVALPDLCGIGATLSKRTRHQRAFLRLLPAQPRPEGPPAWRARADSRPSSCDRSEASASRSGWHGYRAAGRYSRDRGRSSAGPRRDARTAAAARLLPSVRNAVVAESEVLRTAGIPGLRRIRDNAAPETNADAIAGSVAFRPTAPRASSTIPRPLPIEDRHALQLRRPEHLREDPAR